MAVEFTMKELISASSDAVKSSLADTDCLQDSSLAVRSPTIDTDFDKSSSCLANMALFSVYPILLA